MRIRRAAPGEKRETCELDEPPPKKSARHANHASRPRTKARDVRITRAAPGKKRETCKLGEPLLEKSARRANHASRPRRKARDMRITRAAPEEKRETCDSPLYRLVKAILRYKKSAFKGAFFAPTSFPLKRRRAGEIPTNRYASSRGSRTDIRPGQRRHPSAAGTSRT